MFRAGRIVRMLVGVAAMAACAPSAPPTDTGTAATDATDAIADTNAGPADVVISPRNDESRLDDSLDASGRGVHVRTVRAEARQPVTFTVHTTSLRVIDVEATAPAGARVSYAEVTRDAPAWFRPEPFDPAGGRSIVVRVDDSGTAGEITLRIRSYGAPAGTIERDRSLVWTDAMLTDDRAAIGLGRLMRVLADDDHGGRLFESWLRRFGSTIHSERAGPVQLADEIAVAQGSDASRWNLDALPFRVTAVHNRFDLSRGDDCGEFRVSLASTHATYSPLHLLFLFRQTPMEGDVSPAGEVHCTRTAMDWASLSRLEPTALAATARRILDAQLRRDRFIIAETVEFTTSPWEWRQWQLDANPDPRTVAVLPRVFENIPLFQTADIDGLNAASPRRDRFLAWVRDNAAALDARRMEIPAEFRAASARVTQGIPRTALDLSGIDPAATMGRPLLRQHIEIVGCPACHSADAPFVQTLPDRSFSPFYTKELLARGRFLAARAAGLELTAPFGPLQPDPVLPP